MKVPKPHQNGVFPDRTPNTVGAAPAVGPWRFALQQMMLRALFVVIIGAALGVAGPYGTYGVIPLPKRLFYWVLIIFVPWVVWESLFALARARLPQGLGSRTLMALLMPIFAVMGSLFATGFSALVFGLGDVSFTEAWAGSLISWLLFSFLVVLPLALIIDALARQQRKQGGEHLLGFFALKLPEKLRDSTLIALNSEGHYLRVYTSLGDDLILMSMEDAMSALSAYPGVRTHRSWWVAEDQIADTVSAATITNTIATQSGLDVPVSRRRRNAVRDLLSKRAGVRQPQS